MNISIPAETGSASQTWCWLRSRPTVSTEMLVVAAALWFVVFDNAVFWRAAVTDPLGQWRWALGLGAVLLAVHVFLLGLLLWRWSAKPVLALLIPASALAAHYMAAYGIYIDAEMARNVIHADAREASELMGRQILPPLLGCLPAWWLLWRVRLRRRRWKAALGARIVLLLAAVLLAGAAGAAISQALSSLLRNRHEVRYLVPPANLLVATTKSLAPQSVSVRGGRIPVGLDARQDPRPVGSRPRLLVLVVGETVRAANWGLNGYPRQTTPRLAAMGDAVTNFPRVRACGSSTEVSRPCMFSPQRRADYDAAAIRSQESLLHVLARAGIDVLWRDKQSGCKGVCEGLPYQKAEARKAPAECPGGHCLDGALLADPPRWLGDGSRDREVVLHMLGNHGPAYSERYPPAFRRHLPVCENRDLGRCSRESIVNAYDNAVLYTDDVLARAIALLDTQATYDAALLYVSDHGESLGEKGLYLHGMPQAIAPDEQMRVPMVWWMSRGFAATSRLDGRCLAAQAGAPRSHDNLFHSVLGVFGVDTSAYRPERDIFAPCTAPVTGPDGPIARAGGL